MHSLFSKRLFDIFLSFFGIIIALPAWLLISLLIFSEDGGPIYYLQDRVGKNGRIFKIIKFRSMISRAEDTTGPLQAGENDSRVTKIGMMLRKTAMDELPQLVNIFKGDMSFVGPRALRPAEIQARTGTTTDLVHAEFRHLIRPGLTGMAQVFAPTDIEIEKKFRYDRWYIRNCRLPLDLWLIAVSFLITFRARWETRQKKLRFIKDFTEIGK
ncbi:MAG: sugar transferase [Candidatus Omnitrophica bacterium]|nr:sugar transferase [Candidatus Omnitrophota bacterium]